jgi:hypothetical protein
MTATTWRLGTATIARSALIVLLAAACGVQEHLHNAQAKLDHSSDFGGSGSGNTSAGSVAPTTLPPVTTAGAGGMGGTVAPPAGMGGAAGTMVTPNAGSGASGSGVAGNAGGMGGSTMSSAGAGGAGGGAAGSAAPSGVTIDLGGTNVAKEDAIAFIHIGHSNMAGRAIGPATTKTYFTTTDPHAWMYHTGKPPELAKEPYTAGDDLSGLYGGPGTALLKQAVELAPDKYFVSLGFGKTSAYCSQFLPGSLYYDSLMEAPLAIKDKVTFAAIVIMLGITERHGTSADISGYAECINKLVTAIRKDVGRPDLPLLITDYEQEASGALSVSSAFAQSIIPEIHKIPMVVSNSVLVPTDGLSMQDDHHFDFDGHKEWTHRVLQIMKDKGWFPWK